MSKLCLSMLAAFLVCSICQVSGYPDKDETIRGPPHGPMIIPGLQLPKQDIEKCLKEVGMTKEDMQSRMQNKGSEPGEKELCFARCMAIASETLDSDGMLNIDTFKAKLEHNADTIIPCLEKIDTISECQDMSKVMACFPKPPAV